VQIHINPLLSSKTFFPNELDNPVRVVIFKHFFPITGSGLAFIVIVQVVAKVKSNNFIEMNQLNEWQIVVLAASLKNSPASDLITADLKNMLRTFFFIPFNGSVNIQFCIYTDFDLNELFFDNSIVST
jgi:hypothetical protein